MSLPHITDGSELTTTIWNNVVDAINAVPSPGSALVFDAQVGRGNSGDPAAGANAFDTNTILGGNLPTGYTHLRLILVERSTIAANNDNCYIRFNGDSGSNYDYDGFYGQGGAYGSVNQGNAAAQGLLGYPPGTTPQANAAAVYHITIPNYNGTTFNKNALCYGGWNGASGATSIFVSTVVGWRSTAAITRLQVGLASAMVTGSRLTCYGLK